MPPVVRRRLEGKAAIVTGAGTGIGEAVARRFARDGARVLLNGLPGDPVEDVAKAIRREEGDAVAFEGDVADEDQARECVDRAVEVFGALDVLVNNAGVFTVTAPVEAYPVEEYDRTVRMNQRSAFLMTRFALPHLQRRRGVVLCTGSESGKVGLPMNAPYGGTKGWLHAFVRGLAVEQAEHGVRANCVCPGATDTAWTHASLGPMDAEMERMVVEATPLGRRGTPEEMANVFAFLASDEASYVTGALWSVDGGITVAKGAVGAKVPEPLRAQPADRLGLAHQHEGLRGKPVRTHGGGP